MVVKLSGVPGRGVPSGRLTSASTTTESGTGARCAIRSRTRVASPLASVVSTLNGRPVDACTSSVPSVSAGGSPAGSTMR